MKKPRSLRDMSNEDIRKQLRRMRQRGTWKKPAVTRRHFKLGITRELRIDDFARKVTLVLSIPAMVVGVVVDVLLRTAWYIAAVLVLPYTMYLAHAEYNWVEATFPPDESDAPRPRPVPPSCDSDEWEPL